MNVTLVAGFMIAVLILILPRKSAIPIAIFGIWVYSLLSGFDAPIIRAAIMGSIAFTAVYLGRLNYAWRALFIAILIVLIINPMWIYDVGFILSFAATGSLVLFKKTVRKRINFVPGLFKERLSTSLSATSLENSSQEYQVLKDAVGGSGVEVVYPTTGMVIGNSKIYLDIVHPNQDFIDNNGQYQNNAKVLSAHTSKRDPNDFSVVAILRLREFDALLTGDIGPDMMDEVIRTGKVKDVEYIKIPHHGSKNGLTENLLLASTPEVAVISVGKNRWGHPHQDILDLLNKFEIATHQTVELGDVELVTDGKNWEIIQNNYTK